MSHLQIRAPLPNSLVTELEQLQDQITDTQVMHSYKSSVIKAYLQKIIILFITYSFSEKLRKDGLMNEKHQSCLVIGTILGLTLLHQTPTREQITGFSEKRAQANLSGSLKALASDGAIKRAPKQSDLEKIVKAIIKPHKKDIYKLQDLRAEDIKNAFMNQGVKLDLNTQQFENLAKLMITPDALALVNLYEINLNKIVIDLLKQLHKAHTPSARKIATDKFQTLLNHLEQPSWLSNSHPLIELKNKCLFKLALDSTFNQLLAQVKAEESTETSDQTNSYVELTYNYASQKTRKTGKKEKPKGVGDKNLDKLKQKLEQEKEKAKQAAASAAHTASQVANQAAVDALEAQKAAELALNKLLSKSNPAKTAAKDAAICALNAAAFAKHVAKTSKYQVQLAIKKKEESESKKLKAKAKTAAFRASSAASMGAASAHSAVDKVLNLLKEQKQKRDLEKKQKRQEFLEKRKRDVQKLQADHAEQESKASDSEQTAAMTAVQIVETQESKSHEVQHPAAMTAAPSEASQQSKALEVPQPAALAAESAAAEVSLMPPCGAFEAQPQFQPMQTIDPLQTQQGALPGMMPGIMPFMPHLVMTPNFETMQLMHQQMFLQQKDAFICELMSRLDASEQELYCQRVVNGDLAQSLVNQGDSHSRTYMSLHEKLNELIEEKFQREAEAARGTEPS